MRGVGVGVDVDVDVDVDAGILVHAIAATGRILSQIEYVLLVLLPLLKLKSSLRAETTRIAGSDQIEIVAYAFHDSYI